MIITLSISLTVISITLLFTLRQCNKQYKTIRAQEETIQSIVAGEVNSREVVGKYQKELIVKGDTIKNMKAKHKRDLDGFKNLTDSLIETISESEEKKEKSTPPPFKKEVRERSVEKTKGKKKNLLN